MFMFLLFLSFIISFSLKNYWFSPSALHFQLNPVEKKKLDRHTFSVMTLDSKCTKEKKIAENCKS